MSPAELERAVTEIETTYTRVRDRWLASPAYSTLRALILAGAASHAPVTTAVCLGNGPLHAPDSNWDRRRTAHVQTAALLALVDLLSESQRSSAAASVRNPIRCVFQEPEYTPADRAFLQRRGHDVVDDPAAFGLVGASTLLWGVHMYHQVYSRALQGNNPNSPAAASSPPPPPPPLPAMFVGTKWTTWEDVADDDGRVKDSLSRVAEMHATYDMLEFPPDEASFSFGDTCIYWRKEDRTANATESSHCAPTVELPQG